MAVSPIKLALMGVLVAGAAWMGYTTLFPEQTSVYSEQASQTSNATNTDLTAESASIAESAPTTTLSEQGSLEEASSEAPLGAINQALADNIAKLGKTPESVPPLPPLGLGVQTYLSKLSELQLATVDARVREQKLRAQPDNRMAGLGLESTPVMVSPAVSAPVKKTNATPDSNPMMLGSLVQVEDGQWQARLHLHGRWHKVSPGMKLGKVSILSITEQGVRLRDNGKVRWLRMGGQG
ncbi:hypothetical protein [Vibrio campbellii]|uniref:hypothetical protein n=1 Tax=Vibrio campbellii TaxID=680 RepID=UPI001F31085E|nr:hypothetical protein [Vibrio campbellii]MCE7732999.1 hypothetical protein [Vibrio campbellii]